MSLKRIYVLRTNKLQSSQAVKTNKLKSSQLIKYFCVNDNALKSSQLIVSATRRSRYIKIPLSRYFDVTTMDARKSAIFAIQFVKPILQTITHMEVVYVTMGNPAFWLFLHLTGVHFRGDLITVTTRW